jgi:hypothetical protein
MRQKKLVITSIHDDILKPTHKNKQKGVFIYQRGLNEYIDEITS